MSFEIRRFVSGCEADGTAVIDADETVEPLSIRALPGVKYYQIWGTNDRLPVVGNGKQAPTFVPYFPPAGGIRFMVLSWPPDSQPAAEGAPSELAAEMERVFPGLRGAVQPDEAGMHATDSVDMTLILDGELWLELDDGSEVQLTAGNCVVQRGARHSWHNRGDKSALMACIFVGAQRQGW